MALTVNQFNTLKSAIIADAIANGFRTAGDTFSLLAYVNGSTNTSAWRAKVTGGEIYDAHKITEYIARSTAERSAFDLMSGMSRIHDFNNAAKRNGVADIFSGSTNNSSRSAIFAVAQEPATWAQVAIGGNSASVGGTSNMSETVTALKRNYFELVSQDEANRLVN